MNPRASASFCHCPKLTSTPSGQVGPSWVSSPASKRSMTSSAPARPTAASDRRLVVVARLVAEPDAVLGAELEPEEVLERAGQPGPPPVGRHAGQVDAVDEDAAARRLVELGEQLHERGLAGAVLADDRDHRAGRQLDATRPASTSRSVPG